MKAVVVKPRKKLTSSSKRFFWCDLFLPAKKNLELLPLIPVFSFYLGKPE